MAALGDLIRSFVASAIVQSMHITIPYGSRTERVRIDDDGWITIECSKP